MNNHSSILFQYVSGNIRNTEKVYYKERHNFILKIIARDCGGRQSKAVFINILVKEKCKPQWTSKGILQIKLTSRRLSVWNLLQCQCLLYSDRISLLFLYRYWHVEQCWKIKIFVLIISKSLRKIIDK